MNILISGGFKTGTSTLQTTFNCSKTHDIYLKDQDDKVDVLIIPFRENEYVFKSALFQDITEPLYDYCPFAKGNYLDKFENLTIEERENIIKNTDVDQLIQHYKKINWKQYEHLNSKYRLETLNKFYGINIDYTSKNIQVFNLINGENKFKIISFNISIINDIFEELKMIIYGEKKDDIILKNDNIGNLKWYNTKYNEFLQYIDNELKLTPEQLEINESKKQVTVSLSDIIKDIAAEFDPVNISPSAFRENFEVINPLDVLLKKINKRLDTLEEENKKLKDILQKGNIKTIKTIKYITKYYK